MPSIDVDVHNVPDIIEAQLTLSYSRLSDLIRVIVEQGNGHEDDIDEIRDCLEKLVLENRKLRTEVETLKQKQEPDTDITAVLEELKNTVKQLGERADANAAQIADVTAAQTALAASLEKQAEAQQTKVQASVADHAAAVNRRLAASERSMQVVQAFTDLWGATPDQLLEMGRRNPNNEIEHSLKDRTTYLLSMPAFVKMSEEMDVLRALLQRQAADALAAKTSEVARTSRVESLVVPPPQENKDNSAAVEELAKAVYTVEMQMQLVEKQRLPPLESAVSELQNRGNVNARASDTEKEVSRLHEQVSMLESRLNTLLGMSAERTGAPADSGEANLALVDLARRVSMLENTVEGLPRSAITLHQPGSTPSSAEALIGGAGGGEVISADGGARPSSSRGPQGRPPSGRPGSGLLPTINKDIQVTNSSGTVAKTSSPPPRRTSTQQQRQSYSGDIAQPTVEELRRQETSKPPLASGDRRISVAVEPDDGLRRRVSQLEENTAILEVNKADRKELQELETALRHALNSMSHPHSMNVQNSTPLIPQRPISAGGRFVQNHASSPLMDYAQAQRGDAYNRPASTSGALGRPMFVGSSTSVYLRDGAQLTNATVSCTGETRA